MMKPLHHAARHALAAIALALTAAAAPAAFAADYEVDSAHTTALFQISHLGFSNTYGMFGDVSGTLSFDPDDPEKCSISIVIKTDSINTLNDARDNHLRGADFLNVEEYPEMTFKSTKWNKVGNDTWEVTGDFTLHGVTKPVTTVVQRIGEGAGMKGEERVGFETTFTIKRSEFGMDKMLPGVGDEVKITFGAEAIKKDAAE